MAVRGSNGGAWKIPRVEPEGQESWRSLGRDEGERGEISHFLEIAWSCHDYERDAGHDVARFEAAVKGMDPLDKALWECDPEQLFKEIKMRIQMNAQFLSILPVPDVCGVDLGYHGQQLVSNIPLGHRVASRNASKVRSTLRQFVREWSKEGEVERASSFDPLMDALERHMPPPPRNSRARKPHVLCPGCGLGRLPFELVRRGYAAQGNEFSYHMLLGSHLMFNRCQQAETFMIYPFTLTTSNRDNKSHHLRPIMVPDVCPVEALPDGGELSMAAGEFVEVYKDQVSSFDAVLTQFFIDTAKNVFMYIRLLAQIIRQDGLWINLGPLLWHYADTESEISIELSWEELKPAISKYFDIKEETRRDSSYTSNPGNLMAVKYHCIFFVAARNAEPISGISKPVY